MKDAAADLTQVPDIELAIAMQQGGGEPAVAEKVVG